MRKINRMIIVFVVLSSTAFTGCKLEGCTDPNAMNFIESADVDNGTCRYAGESVIWYNQATAQSYQNNGATAITFEVDGSFYENTSATTYWSSAPTCNESGSITVNRDLLEEKSKTLTLRVMDQTGYEYYNGTITLEGGICGALQLQ